MTVKSEALVQLEALLKEMLWQCDGVNDSLLNCATIDLKEASLSLIAALNLTKGLTDNVLTAMDLTRDLVAPPLN